MEGEGEGAPWVGRDTLIPAGALLIASVLAWRWLATSDMGDMDIAGMSMAGMEGMPMAGMTPTSWTPAYGLSVFLMWAIMMVAMMLPSAAPMMLLYARVARGSAPSAGLPSTFVFISAYVAVWTAFSLLATAAQWGLSMWGLLDPPMRFSGAMPGGILLIGAGLYQLTPLKRICLSHCRAPLTFLTLHWRPGLRGAVGMGLHHGAACVGCCWFVMTLLFVGGLMNLAWVVVLAAFVLAEKLLPFGERVRVGSGVLAAVAGAYLIVTPLLG